MTVPNYQSFETIPLTAGAEVEGIVLDPAAGWEPDVEEIARRLRPTTKLVAVNFPDNPTGAICSPGNWRAFVDLCHEHGATLLSDEVCRGLETDESRRLPPAAELSDSALSRNVMSKSYGLPGYGSAGWRRGGATCSSGWSAASTTRRSATRRRARRWRRSRSATAPRSRPATAI